MDYFSGPIGLHTSACVFMGFMQTIVQQLLAPREGYDLTQRPTVQRMGLAWYVTYAGVLTLAHHSWFFFMEVFRFADFFPLTSVRQPELSNVSLLFSCIAIRVAP